MTPEQVLDNEIKIWCGQHNMLVFHCNVFKGLLWDEQQKKERYIQSGFPKGFPDLLIINNYNEVAFCETKIHPRKPTKEQIKMLTLLSNRGFNSFVAYSLEEFIEKLKIKVDNLQNI